MRKLNFSLAHIITKLQTQSKKLQAIWQHIANSQVEKAGSSKLLKQEPQESPVFNCSISQNLREVEMRENVDP